MNPKIAAIQLTSGLDLHANLKAARDLLTQAAEQGATLAVLPEMFSLLGQGPAFAQAKLAIQEREGKGPVQDFLAEESRRLKMWIIGGTHPMASSDPHKSYASSLVYNDQGENIARYDKIKMFDVELSDQERYCESDTTKPGSKIVVIDSPLGRIGLSVCFDLRFPELFREMFRQGAEIFVIPSAFTVPTGEKHWEILLRARAIENFAYVVAAAQTGTHGQGRKTYGHSLIIAPGGQILASLDTEPGVILSEVDLAYVREQRRRIPATS